VVREVHYSRGVLNSKIAAEEVKTFTIKSVDAKAKTLIIEHPQRYGYKLLDQKPSETTSNAYRFEVKLAPSATETFVVREERIYDQGTSISNMTPDMIVAWMQGKPISAAARTQLQQIAQKKSEVAANDTAIAAVERQMRDLDQDQNRQPPTSRASRASRASRTWCSSTRVSLPPRNRNSPRCAISKWNCAARRLR
jgi:hypothetical protein